MSDQLFFSAYEPEHGVELWVSDGSEIGTRRIDDLYPGIEGSNPGCLTADGDRLFVSLWTPYKGLWIWVTDGTPEGTAPFAGFGDKATCMAGKIGGLFLLIGPREGPQLNPDVQPFSLWASDGTETGTLFLTDILRGVECGGGCPSGWGGLWWLAALDDRLYFSRSDEQHGSELWVSDGTAKGTKLFLDLVPGPEGSDPQWMTAVGNQLFFSAHDPEHGRELWVSDGTETGTVFVKDILPGVYWEGPKSLVALGDRVFFLNYLRDELWVSDGTEQGTLLLKASPEPGIHSLLPVGDRLFFSVHGELWVSNGTEAGTVFVKGSLAGIGTAVGDRLYFSTYDPEHGHELWVSDGTEAGTMLEAYFAPGAPGSYPRNLTAVGELLFFTDYVEKKGSALWVLDVADVPTEDPRFRRGDTNADNAVEVSDAITTLGFLFLGAPEHLACEKTADVNDDGVIDLSDPVSLLNHLFLGPSPPPQPFGECGMDPTEDGLGCDEGGPCA